VTNIDRMIAEPARRAARHTVMTARSARLRSVATVLAAMLLASGCARPTTSSEPGAGPSVPVTAPSSGGCPPTLAVHSSDDGKSLCVALGGTVDLDWTGLAEPEPKGDALQLVPVPMREQTDRYEAASRGVVTFTSARRACTPSPGQMACGALVAWTVTVEVR
jgi:hypothetical protein